MLRFFPRNRWLRRSLYLLLLVLLGGSTLFGYRYIVYCQSLAYEERILAELSRIDPDWTWEKMIAQSPNLPDDQNGYLRLKALLSKYAAYYSPVISMTSSPTPQSTSLALGPVPNNLPPLPARPRLSDLDHPLLEYPEFKKEFDELLMEFRKQVNYPQGWMPIPRGEDLLNGTATPVSMFQQTLSWLNWDAQRQALLNVPELAILDLRAALAGAHAFGTPGVLYIQAISRKIEQNSVTTLEQILAWCTPSAQELLKLQDDLEKTLQQCPLVDGLRFERASNYQQMSQIAAAMSDGPALPGAASLNAFNRFLLNSRYPMYAPADRAHLLEDTTRAIELLKSNSPEIKAILMEWESEIEKMQESQKKGDGEFVNNMPPSKWLSSQSKLSYYAMIKSHFSWQANLRCGLGAIAAERFRQSNGRWPKNWEELVPQYLKEVPQDPWSDKPLRMRKTQEGLTIYSVGVNRVDDGGIPEVLNLKLDLGFRLFHPEKRKALP